MVLKYLAGASLRIAGIACATLVISPLLLAAPTPAWWAQRGAIDSQSNDDSAAASLGQLKHMASKARDELKASLPDGVCPEVDALIDSFGVNLTQLPGVAATESSPYNDSQIHPTADRAIDGNTDGDYSHASVAHTDSTSNPWLQVNLGGTSMIRNVEIWNRTDAYSSRTKNFYVFISNLDMSGYALAQLLANNGIWKSAKITQAPAPSLNIDAGSQPGRYVMVCIESGSQSEYLNLAEVKVLGVTNTEAPPMDDFAASTLGQLKAISKPFYTRLIALGYLTRYPWDGHENEADDFAPASLGQVKQFFSFDLARDTDGDGMPDMLELANGLNPERSDLTLDTDGDGISDIWELMHGMDPNWPGDKLDDFDGDGINNFAEYNNHTDSADYFNGAPVQITVVSGAGQRGLPSRQVNNPVRVQLKQNGTPMVNAPLKFTAGRGRILRDKRSRKQKMDILRTDSEGCAQVDFITSSVSGSDILTISAGRQSVNIPLIVDYNLPPAAPSNVAGTLNENNSGVHITWQDNSLDEANFIIERSYNGEDWIVVGIVQANITSFDDPQPPVSKVNYRVISSYGPE